MRLDTFPRKGDPHVVSIQCGEMLFIKVLDDCGQEVVGLTVGTVRFPEGSVGCSVTLPAPHYRSQGGNYILLEGLEADKMVFWKGETAELRLEKVDG